MKGNVNLRRNISSSNSRHALLVASPPRTDEDKATRKQLYTANFDTIMKSKLPQISLKGLNHVINREVELFVLNQMSDTRYRDIYYGNFNL